MSSLPRTHQIHTWELKSEGWRKRVAFRDYLSTHRDAFDQCVALKQELVARLGNDRIAYSNAKDDFVKRILQLAEDKGTS
ncbi:MAG: GrpB family protein [SAR202 cluster bacterium]|nr:GrpB family protein [SAR202 cluster bacterium]